MKLKDVWLVYLQDIWIVTLISIYCVCVWGWANHSEQEEKAWERRAEGLQRWLWVCGERLPDGWNLGDVWCSEPAQEEGSTCSRTSGDFSEKYIRTFQRENISKPKWKQSEKLHMENRRERIITIILIMTGLWWVRMMSNLPDHVRSKRGPANSFCGLMWL